MTNREAKTELERIVEEEYPLIASQFIDIETMLKAAREINYEVREWRGVDFPYRRLHDSFMKLISLQYLTTSLYDIFERIGEEKVVGFLNKYYWWEYNEHDKEFKELNMNLFELTEEDKADFERFNRIRPEPCKEPLDIAGYLHMCRIAYDAAPKLVYPSFVSDLIVVAHAKFNDCGLARKRHDEKMKAGDHYPDFMGYHPAEMGFGGPDIRFEWEDGGWVMHFFGRNFDYRRTKNKDIVRFLAMRRAGYPVVYEEQRW